MQPQQGGAPVNPMAWAYVVVVDVFRNERGNICGTNLGRGGIGGHRIEVGELYFHQNCMHFILCGIYLCTFFF